GREANFRNTIIIMTSNIGSEVILENFEDLQSIGGEHRSEVLETTKLEVFELLKANMRPEFLNRIDERIMFLPLTQEEIKEIAQLHIKKVRDNLHKHGLSLEISDAAMDLIADMGYEPQFGARPLKRVIQRELVNELSVLLLGGDFEGHETVYVDADPGGLKFSLDNVSFYYFASDLVKERSE